MKANEAKVVWSKLQREIIEGHAEVCRRLTTSRPTSFYNFLHRHYARTNHFEPKIITKLKYYGNVMFCLLLHVEHGHLYIEYAYYPMSLERFGTRIAIDAKDTYSRHYVERLIERKKVKTLAELKTEVIDQFSRISDSNFRIVEGRIDVCTDIVLLFDDMVVFGVVEENDDGSVTATRKSMLTNNELTSKQHEIVQFILGRFDLPVCVLATHEIPRTHNEALNVIEDTRKRIRLDDDELPQISTKESHPRTTNALHKKIDKAFFKFLQAYDPLFYE
ncbi:hypothetical protein [Thaumasiovibrio sp. DFM-14]|uniref:hypothetical protein n=1 Tax=Thaumasiovibrio sp. DFM-14 TaxID=3384792 RepID=UPI0039A2AABD